MTGWEWGLIGGVVGGLVVFVIVVGYFIHLIKEWWNWS